MRMSLIRESFLCILFCKKIQWSN